MLSRAHKEILVPLARKHEQDLRDALTQARRHFGSYHTTVIVLERRVQLAKETVRALEAEPVQAAA